MRVQHTVARRRRAHGAIAAVLALSLIGAASVVAATSAAADTITVPFQDRLGCIAAGDYATTSSPVFSKAGGSGAVTNGATMPFDSAVSAYPMQPGVFSNVSNPTGSFGYGSFGQEGYGSTTYYSGANGIGFSSIDGGAQGTLTVTMPYPQRVQFTIGGIDAPSGLDVSGAGPGGAAVPAQSAAKSTSAGSATVQTVGTTARVAGANQPAGTVDNVPQKAVDVWFDQPVSTLTFRVSGNGSATPADGGFLVTPPLGCQSGTVDTPDATATPTDVQQDAQGDTTVTYTVPVSTSVRNTAGTTDMTLFPTVRSDLRTRVEAAGGTLDAIRQVSASSTACALPGDALPTGHLLGSTGPLGPGVACTQTAEATVTLPLDADPRTLTLTSTLASSANDTYARVKASDTAAVTFPAVRSALTVTADGPNSALPTAPVQKTFTVEGTGPDTSGPSTIRIDDPNGFPARSCSVSGLETQPTCEELLSGDPVSLGTIGAGQTRTVTIRGVVPSGTAAGTRWPLTATVSSPVDTTGTHEVSTTLAVAGPGRPGVTSPAAGSTTTERRPTIAGNNVPHRASVEVLRGNQTVCTATGDGGGYWSCVPTADLPVGTVTLRVTDTFGGITGPEGGVTFTVRAPATPPGGTTPVPGTGGGSAGGPGGTAPGGSGSAGTGDTGNAGRSPSALPTNPSSPNSPSTPAPGNGSGGGNGAGSTGGSGAGGPDAAGTNDGPMAMDLRFGTQRILPGTAADMRGTLGPNGSGATVAITFQARMSTGMVYRNVDVEVDDQPLDCTVATTSFSCMIPLDPGQQADVDVRVYADPVNAPDTAVQQISLASNRASQANAITVTTAVAKGETEASQLADQITTFNVTEFPGAMVPLLAMLLFALAATVAGRRAASGPAAAATTPPTGSGPPEPSRASSPTSPRPTTDPPSGSNR